MAFIDPKTVIHLPPFQPFGSPNYGVDYGQFSPNPYTAAPYLTKESLDRAVLDVLNSFVGAKVTNNLPVVVRGKIENLLHEGLPVGFTPPRIDVCIERGHCRVTIGLGREKYQYGFTPGSAEFSTSEPVGVSMVRPNAPWRF